MVYIFDGSDLSGKTTLAKEFSEIKKIPIIKKRLDLFLDKEGRFLKGDMIEKITQFFFESVIPLKDHTDFILDRSLISSLVYSTFFGRNLDSNYIYKYLLETKYNQNIKIFLIHTNWDSLEYRFNHRGEKLFSLGEIKEISNMYQSITKVLMNQGANIEMIYNPDGSKHEWS